MTDARFADADPAPLALLAGDAEDLSPKATGAQSPLFFPHLPPRIAGLDLARHG